MSENLPTGFPLKQGRVHEVCGSSAFSFAAICIANSIGDGKGRALWVREHWKSDLLNPVGLADFFDPARLLIVEVKDQVEALAVAEEALRDGSCAFVVMELGKPLEFTPGRRLQLAAQAGKATGLCLIQDGMGSTASESRWTSTPVLDKPVPADPDKVSPENRIDSTLYRWKLIKNKSGTLGIWHVRWNAAAHRLFMVSEVRE